MNVFDFTAFDTTANEIDPRTTHVRRRRHEGHIRGTRTQARRHHIDLSASDR